MSSLSAAMVHFLTSAKSGQGVLNRLHGQYRACQSLGLPIQFYVVSPDHPDAPIEGINHIVLPSCRTSLGKNRHEVEALGAIMDQYDVVVSRPLLWSHHYYLNLRNRRAKLITEAHGKVLEQSRRLNGWKLYCYERVFSVPCLRLNAGVVAVTNEIGQYIAQLGFPNEDMIRIIPNGIDVRAVEQTGFMPFNGEQLDMVLVASGNAPWLGLDRLLEGLKAFTGPTNITLHLVGGFPDELNNTSLGKHGKIKNHGRLFGDALSALLATMNLAVGTLSFHRSGLEEACTLKVREYMARGLPFMYGYTESEVPENAGYALRVANNDEPIDIQAVLSFAASVSAEGGEKVSNEMRHTAETKLDWYNKMPCYWDFIETVMSGS